MKRMLLESHRYYPIDESEDITFKFYNDNTISIYDNEIEQYLRPKDLSKRAYAFYVLKRIDYIKNYILKTKNENSA